MQPPPCVVLADRAPLRLRPGRGGSRRTARAGGCRPRRGRAAARAAAATAGGSGSPRTARSTAITPRHRRHDRTLDARHDGVVACRPGRRCVGASARLPGTSTMPACARALSSVRAVAGVAGRAANRRRGACAPVEAGDVAVAGNAALRETEGDAEASGIAAPPPRAPRDRPEGDDERHEEKLAAHESQSNAERDTGHPVPMRSSRASR